jgi:3-hydroxybutyryl-CoA dehydratase
LIKIGQQACIVAVCTDESILDFANATGDHNPIHFDDTIAQSAGFKKRIAHGMWSAGLLSAVLGTKLPGSGSIYLNQELNFKAPVYVGDEVTATVLVMSMERSKVYLETSCINQDNQLLVSGSAIILLK